MSGMGIGLLTALTEKMRWSQARQGLLAQNVANADTPNYKGVDLKSFSYTGESSPMGPGPISTVATQPGHIVIAATNSADGFGTVKSSSYEVSPEGNGVTLEDEMMKVTNNQLDYQAVTSLYTRSLQLLRTAIGRTA
jgi:flagellar basal-body rod protein FlgB